MIQTLGLDRLPLPSPVPADAYQQIADSLESRFDGTGSTSLENPRTPLNRIFNVEASPSGKVITAVTALTIATVWRAVNLIGGAIARTPFMPYQRNEGGRDLARNHYTWQLLMQRANPYTTSYRFKRMMQTWLLLRGNAYAEIETNGRGQIVALWPWRPDRVKIDGAGATTTYTYWLQNGSPVTLPWQMVLHLRGLETDGQKGLDPISVQRNSLGLAAAAEEYGARYFSNNGRPGGWIEHPGQLGKEGQKNLRETLDGLHRGLKGAHRVAILEEGMKYHDVGISPENMQFLETRKFQAVDVARWYGVPPHMIAEMEHATFSNIEHQSIEFVSYCLDDWFCNWESECQNSLLSEREAEVVEFLFLRQRLLRGDMKSRFEAYAIARSWGAMSANMWLEEEGLNRRSDPAGDDFLIPLNYTVSGNSSPDPVDPEDPNPDEATDPEDTPATPAPATNPAPVPAAAGRSVNGHASDRPPQNGNH